MARGLLWIEDGFVKKEKREAVQKTEETEKTEAEEVIL